VPDGAPDGGPRLIVLRDRPFLIVTGLVAIMSLHFSLLEVGVPLWVQGHTEAPRITVAIVFIVNCVLVALLSVRLARGSDTVAGAARAGARSGIVLAASCVLFAASSGPGATVAAAILIAAGVVEVLGEIVQAASGWGLGFGLAPEHAQGQYQGAAATGFALSLMLGPALMAAVTSAGTAGWLAFGAVFLVTGFVTIPVAAWAMERREAATAVL
jgi:MFS family permease